MTKLNFIINKILFTTYFFNFPLNFLVTFEGENDDFVQKVKELGGWPVLEGEKWNSKSFKWIKVLVNMREMGFQIKFPVSISMRKVPVVSSL